MAGSTGAHTSSKRIRDSCNSCSSQKVRCGKERPSCARCITKGYVCNYSLSQRTGRRHSSVTPSTPIATTPTASEHIITVPALDSSAPLLTPALQSTPHFMSSSTDPSGNDIDFSQNFDYSMSYGLPWLSNESDPHSTQTTALNATISQPCSQTIDQSTFQTEDSAVNTEPTFLQHQGSEDCMILALELVRSLHVSVMTCSTVASNTGGRNNSIVNHIPSIQPKREDRRDIDQVFINNRDAVKSLHKILDCGCSASPSVALACYLATGKIIRWYQAAIGSSEEAEATEDRKSMPEQIVAHPIYMGRYCLHPTTQLSVRASAVLNELKEQVQPLLARLDQKGHNYIPRDGDPMESAKVPVLNDKPGDALRKQIREIVKEADDACQCLQRQGISDLWAMGTTDDNAPISRHQA